MTKNSPAKATDAHISIVGHITKAELKSLITDCDLMNGMANRFLWVCVKRSKLLPDGGDLQSHDLQPLADRINNCVEFAQQCTRIERDDEARELWHEVYPELSEGKHGLFGAVISRSEAQVTRLSMLYALLDQSQFIRKPHLQAALEVWRYCEQSAAYIFGGEVKAPPSGQEKLTEWLRTNGKSTVRNIQRGLSSIFKTAEQVEKSLNSLREQGAGDWLPVEITSNGGTPKRYFQLFLTDDK